MAKKKTDLKSIAEELATHRYFSILSWARQFCIPLAGSIVWAIALQSAGRGNADLAGLLAGTITIAISYLYISLSEKNIKRLKLKITELERIGRSELPSRSATK